MIGCANLARFKPSSVSRFGKNQFAKVSARILTIYPILYTYYVTYLNFSHLLLTFSIIINFRKIKIQDWFVVKIRPIDMKNDREAWNISFPVKRGLPSAITRQYFTIEHRYSTMNRIVLQFHWGYRCSPEEKPGFKLKENFSA